MKLHPRLWLLVAAVFPCVVVAWLNAWFVWNHFVQGAYLHDSGWYSYIVWHNGLLPKNPAVAEHLPDYYGIHVSPLVSIASVLSYIVPLDRVRWYCLFQAALYAPLAFAATRLVARGRRWRDALAVSGAALAFALSGQVIQCIRYPHFEIFVVVGVAFMLVGLATGRTKLAWTGLVMAVATREDGGFHAALFCAVVVLCDLSGRPFPVPRKTAVTMFAVATLASVLAFGFQKTFFQSANLFRHEYLGETAYAHVTGAEVVRRTRLFFSHASFVSFPLMGTFVIAIARRDNRYLLGWVAELPWLLLNFFAFQPAKFEFTIYTGFPFVASYFWVGVYDLVARRERGAASSPLSPLGALATVSLLSTCGVVYADPLGLPRFLERARGPVETPHQPIEAFVSSLRRDPDTYGRIVVDPSIASWTLESIRREQAAVQTWEVRNFDDLDATAFYATGIWHVRLLWFLARSPFETCGQLRDTTLFFCTRKGRPLPDGFVEASPVTQSLYAIPPARPAHDGFLVDVDPIGKLAVQGPFAVLPRGRYTVTWHLRWGVCIKSTNPVGAFDVMAGRRQLAGLRLEEPQATIEETFVLGKETRRVEIRAWSGRCAYAIDRVDFRATEVPPNEEKPLKEELLE